MLIEIVSNLKISDATQTTKIIDSISGIFSKLNKVKATLKNKIKELMSVEGVAEFNAQIGQVFTYFENTDESGKAQAYDDGRRRLELAAVLATRNPVGT